MRVLLLTHSFNSLSQRLWAELRARGHEVSLEYDIADSVTEEAVALFRPDVVVAPYLRRAIPASVWSRCVCLVVHPGIVGDRGPSALDWAIQRDEPRWGVTVLQAEAAMDAGPVWAAEEFPMRLARKSSLYRREVTDTAVRLVLLALERLGSGTHTPLRPAQMPDARGCERPVLRQAQRAVDWRTDSAQTILRHIHAADGFPGLQDTLFGEPCHLFDACEESQLKGAPGDVIARRETAVLRATVDGAIWIGHVKRPGSIKLPATLAFEEACAGLPEAALPGFARASHCTWQDIAYEQQGDVGWLHFDFYNGAMSTRQCERLREAMAWARRRGARVLVLAGGSEFWSNGIHLNAIEAASLAEGSAADESWRNINAMNDLALDLITTSGQLTVAALAGNAGAGGCFLARAADLVWVREGVTLNPHYRNMGNLYGSEYWTYLLPRRVGREGAESIMRGRQPLTAEGALRIGFADAVLSGSLGPFRAEVQRRAQALAGEDFEARLLAKRHQREADEAAKPLADYRAEELSRMRRNFYGFDPSYHVARHHFVQKSPASWTPRHLARHRELGWSAP